MLKPQKSPTSDFSIVYGKTGTSGKKKKNYNKIYKIKDVLKYRSRFLFITITTPLNTRVHLAKPLELSRDTHASTGQCVSIDRQRFLYA